MNCILCSVSTELSSYGVWCFDLSCLCVGRSNSLSPGSYSVVLNKLHTDRNVARHVSGKVREELLSNMLSIELLDSVLVKL